MRPNSAACAESAATLPRNTDTIDRHTAAALIGVSTRTLQRWNRLGNGPPRELRGRKVRYSRVEVEGWLFANSRGRDRRTSLSDLQATARERTFESSGPTMK